MQASLKARSDQKTETFLRENGRLGLRSQSTSVFEFFSNSNLIYILFL